VRLQVRLEVEVRDRVLVRDLEEARQDAVRNNAALVRRVEAVVRLHIGRHELRDLRLRALRTRRETHEGAQLCRQRARLEEGVLRAAEFVRRLLLGRHVRDILLDAALAARILDLARRRLGSVEGVRDRLLELSRHAGADLANVLNDLQERRGRTRRCRLRGRGRRRCGSHDRDRDLRLGSDDLLLLRLGGGGRGRRGRRRGGRRRDDRLLLGRLGALLGLGGAHV